MSCTLCVSHGETKKTKVKFSSLLKKKEVQLRGKDLDDQNLKWYTDFRTYQAVRLILDQQQ